MLSDQCGHLALHPDACTCAATLAVLGVLPLQPGQTRAYDGIVRAANTAIKEFVMSQGSLRLLFTGLCSWVLGWAARQALRGCMAWTWENPACTCKVLFALGAFIHGWSNPLTFPPCCLQTAARASSAPAAPLTSASCLMECIQRVRPSPQNGSLYTA